MTKCFICKEFYGSMVVKGKPVCKRCYDKLVRNAMLKELHIIDK